MTNLIIGYGTVGGNLSREFERLDIDVCDKYKHIDKKGNRHNVGWICVDTPLVNGLLDCTEVFNAVHENDCEVYVIKSTVPVGFTDALKEKTGKRIVFSPEYYGGTQHCNNFVFDFTVLGGDKEDCVVVQQMLQDVYDGRHRFIITNAKTAEMAKFMENSYLATKVTFCNEFYDACEKAGVLYEDVREIFVCDPRVSPSHTFVYRKHPYYKSHCLDKDVPEIANRFDIGLLKDVIKRNQKRM